MATDIEWADEVWNFILGCSKVSEGCGIGGANCYAIYTIHRELHSSHLGLTVETETGLDWTGELRVVYERLDLPYRWQEPRRIFVNSLSDLFHDRVPFDVIEWAFAVMADTPRHTYQIMTKYPKRMARIAKKLTWSENIWMGVSIETNKYTWRANYLRRVPAGVRFLCLEPLLGPLPDLNLEKIDWVIVSGQSGPGAVAMDLGWVRDIRDQCRASGIPLFVKQMGTAWARDQGHGGMKGGSRGQDVSLWPRDLRVQNWPA